MADKCEPGCHGEGGNQGDDLHPKDADDCGRRDEAASQNKTEGEIHTHDDYEEEFEDTSDPEELRKIYDNLSKTYDQDLAKENYNGPRKVAEALAKMLTDKEAEILDIGCCTGLVGEELHKVGFRNIDGVDISDECIKIAREKNVYRRIVNEVIDPEKQTSFKSRSYDVVILVGGGMFLDIKILKEWLRLTKKDGLTVIGIMQKEYETEKYAVPATIDEYVKQRLTERVKTEIMDDFIMGKPGIVEYLKPVVTE